MTGTHVLTHVLTHVVCDRILPWGALFAALAFVTSIVISF